MKLLATLLATAAAGQAQDLSFELTLMNDQSQPVELCAKQIPWSNDLGYHGFGASFQQVGAPSSKPRGVFRPVHPAWGPPAPPYLAGYLAAHRATLAPGQKSRSQVSACVLPRLEVPRGNNVMANTLHPPQGSDPSTMALIVFETRCAELKSALAKDPDAIYGRPAALLAHGEHELTFHYVEQAGFGFKPPQPLHLSAAPIRVHIP